MLSNNVVHFTHICDKSFIGGVFPSNRKEGLGISKLSGGVAINVLIRKLCSEEVVGFVEIFFWEG